MALRMSSRSSEERKFCFLTSKRLKQSLSTLNYDKCVFHRSTELRSLVLSAFQALIKGMFDHLYLVDLECRRLGDLIEVYVRKLAKDSIHLDLTVDNFQGPSTRLTVRSKTIFVDFNFVVPVISTRFCLGSFESGRICPSQPSLFLIE